MHACKPIYKHARMHARTHIHTHAYIPASYRILSSQSRWHLCPAETSSRKQPHFRPRHECQLDVRLFPGRWLQLQSSSLPDQSACSIPLNMEWNYSHSDVAELAQASVSHSWRLVNVRNSVIQPNTCRVIHT